ncbi:hypothetical protein ABZY34_05240 [Streptomyces virginiae]|uniref:hypothetical protein n=1 Tax=Streptomyces virginiae TaxID=1961 RepID=UPI0033A30E12
MIGQVRDPIRTGRGIEDMATLRNLAINTLRHASYEPFAPARPPGHYLTSRST